VRRLHAVLQRRFTPEPAPVADEAFAKSLAKPKRQRGIKSLDDPSGPRNRSKGTGVTIRQSDAADKRLMGSLDGTET
jgi:hypothetical protein